MADADQSSVSAADIARIFEQVDWADVTSRLLIYAQHRLSRYPDLLRVGRSPEDYVQEAVALTLEGRRVFSPEAAYSPLEFFATVIDSLMSHDAEKLRRRPQTSVDGIDVADLRYNVEGTVAAQEEAERFLAALEGELQAYARLRLSGDYTSAEQYARALNMTVSQVRNLDKRLRRQPLKPSSFK